MSSSSLSAGLQRVVVAVQEREQELVLEGSMLALALALALALVRVLVQVRVLVLVQVLVRVLVRVGVLVQVLMRVLVQPKPSLPRRPLLSLPIVPTVLFA